MCERCHTQNAHTFVVCPEMTLFRFIPLSVHAALEILGAMALLAAPFVLDFGPAAMVASVLLGAVLFGLALSTHADEHPSIPLSLHAAADYGLGFLAIASGLLLGLAKGDGAGTVF